MLISCTQRFSHWNNMWFLSDVFITPWGMIKIYVSRMEIPIKQIKTEWENLVKTGRLYCTNCCKHRYCEKLSFRSIVWPQHKFKRFESILKYGLYTHTHTHICKVYLFFVFAWLFSCPVFRFEYWFNNQFWNLRCFCAACNNVVELILFYELSNSKILY